MQLCWRGNAFSHLNFNHLNMTTRANTCSEIQRQNKSPLCKSMNRSTIKKKTACSLKGGFCFQERKKKIRRTQICHSLSAHSHTDTHTEEQPSSVLISEELHYCGCARHNWEWVVVHKHSSTQRMRNLLWLIQVVLRPVVCVLVRWTTTRCLLLSSTERAPTAGPDRLWMSHCDATEPCNWKVGQHPPSHTHTHPPYILTSWTRKYPPQLHEWSNTIFSQATQTPHSQC